MATLLYGPSSPYSAKVRMAAAQIGLELDAQVTDTNRQEPLPGLAAQNPLAKIPVLVTDAGVAVYDSRVIMQELNRMSRNALYPRNAEKRLEAEILEALADGICDCLLAHVYERRLRPEEKVHQPWLDKQWDKALRGLDRLNETPLRLPTKITGGHIAVRAMLGYIALRFPGKWERGRSKLVRWGKRFDEKFPALVAYLPQG